MKIEINLNKKGVFALVLVAVLLIGGIAVYAYGTNNPVVFGHSPGEVEGVGRVITANCNPITPNPTGYNEWTTICSLTTTKTTGTVYLAGSAMVKRLVGLTDVSLRIRDSGNTIMAANTASDYADHAHAIEGYPLNVAVIDTLSGSAKTYYLEVAGYYNGQAFTVLADYAPSSAGGAQGPPMNNSLWFKAIE